MATVTEDEVRDAFEGPAGDEAGYEVLNVERNRSQYRVFLDAEEVTRADAESVLNDAFGEDSVFGVGVTDDRIAEADKPVRVVSFRLR